jgi:hypothetical protein
VRVVEIGILVAIERFFNAILLKVIDLGIMTAMLLRFIAALVNV